VTELIDQARIAPYGGERAGPDHLAGALDDVRRSAQQLLAEVGKQPRALRIRAGDVVVELEWTEQVEPARVQAGSAEPAAALPAAPAAADNAAASGLTDVCAPTVGTFYRAPEPGAAPFVSEGDQVRRGQQIGIVEAMKLMIPIESEGDGQVVAVHITDGTPVEYGDRLFTLAPVAGR
jgi:acetyl-CoA carboxylase biotin carboxyl carrier protein